LERTLNRTLTEIVGKESRIGLDIDLCKVLAVLGSIGTEEEEGRRKGRNR
jgi:hypothetical protein